MKGRRFEIEPGIRPLVDALNATGIVVTFSSCEGHYGVVDPDDYGDKQTAHVIFDPAPGKDESEVLALIFHLLRENRRLGVGEAGKVRAFKHYVHPDDDETVADMEHHFWIEIRPFNPHVAADEKRAEVDRLVQHLASAARALKKAAPA